MIKKYIAAPLVAVLLTLGLSACGGDATPTTTQLSGSPTTAPATGAQVKIIAKDNMFEPVSYTIAAGSFEIVAVNEGKEIHEVEVKGLFPESKLAAGQSKSVILTDVKPGTYKIYCEIHEDQGMEGELIVK
ncbi:MAG: cupredoxin domain-containing protein [Chloroflexota bacterium]